MYVKSSKVLVIQYFSSSGSYARKIKLRQNAANGHFVAALLCGVLPQVAKRMRKRQGLVLIQ
jgi:hypothetical protein